jgi:hypothetical protein
MSKESQPQKDPILQSIRIALDAVKSAGSTGKPGIPPTTGTRLMALLSVAMLNTLASFDRSVKPYFKSSKALNGANQSAAILGAAQRILLRGIPGESRLIYSEFAKAFRGLKLKSVKDLISVKFGVEIADKVIASRSQDGSENQTPLNSNGNPQDYLWKPATSGPTAGIALGVNWGSVKPWVIGSTSAYQTDGLNARPGANLEAYAQQLAEVRLFGGLNDTSLTKTQRTENQTHIAKFWAYDRADTFRPYGQLLDIASEIAANQKTSTQTNAKLFASLSMAMADSVICAWNEKYKVLQPRPYDVITGAFSDKDGTPITVRDSEWQSLLSSINGVQSPPFPDFLSGHSAMGGAFASVMTHFFGDKLVFSTQSQDLPGFTRTFDGSIPAGSLGDIGLIVNSPIYRPNSFYEAGIEDAVSRVYGGVHVREACLDSFNLGVKVGIAAVLWGR